MSIYKALNSSGFERCYPENDDDFEILYKLVNGIPRKATWKSPRMQLIRKDEGKQLSIADSPWLGSFALVFRLHSLECLMPLLRAYGELLPLECDEPGLVIFNATKVIDALDLSNSEVSRLPDGGIFRIARHEFKADAIAGVDAFRIPDLRVSPIYVSQRFIDCVITDRLRGLQFQKVWPL